MTLTDVLKIAKGITDDSRKVESGFVFFCKGSSFKKDYLLSAIERGAIAYVSEVDYSLDIQSIIVPDIRAAMADAACDFYGNPSESLSLVGITGTKGKSTTLYFLKSIMERSLSCGEGKFGYISTIENYDGKRLEESHLTTPEIIDLNEMLSNMVSSGIKRAGMEVSSQGLKYGRIRGLHYQIGGFTNFSEDHISPNEHSSIEDYFESKLKLIECCDNFVVNLDDEMGQKVLDRCKELKRLGKLNSIYAISKNQIEDDEVISIRIENVRKENNMTVFDLSGFGAFTLSMPGLFNVYNAAFAAIFGRSFGSSNDEIKLGLLNAKASGRMEVYVNNERDLVGIVDFAHNKISFEKIFSSVKEEYKGYKINAVFGCPGNKSPERRIELPKIAALYSNYSYITEDDPFHERAEDICEEVFNNLKSFGGKGEIIVDRHEAISTAIKNASPHTVILFLAKGAERYMHRENYDYYESDSVLVNEEFKNN